MHTLLSTVRGGAPALPLSSLSSRSTDSLESLGSQASRKDARDAPCVAARGPCGCELCALQERLDQEALPDGRGVVFGPGGERNRRPRTLLSAVQVDILEREFAARPTPGTAQVARLAAYLELEPRVVRVWFQNRRARRRKFARPPSPPIALHVPSPQATAAPTTLGARDGAQWPFGRHPDAPKHSGPQHPHPSPPGPYTSDRRGLGGPPAWGYTPPPPPDAHAFHQRGAPGDGRGYDDSKEHHDVWRPFDLHAPSVA